MYSSPFPRSVTSPEAINQGAGFIDLDLHLLVYPPEQERIRFSRSMRKAQCLSDFVLSSPPSPPYSVPCWMETWERHHHPRCREEQNFLLQAANVKISDRTSRL